VANLDFLELRVRERGEAGTVVKRVRKRAAGAGDVVVNADAAQLGQAGGSP